MNPGQIDYWITELRRRMKAVEDFVANPTVPYSGVTGLTANRLLGRHSATDGPAELIRVGTGLDLVGDTLVNTGGGTVATAWSSGFSGGFS